MESSQGGRIPSRGQMLLLAVIFEGVLVVLWLLLRNLFDTDPSAQGTPSMTALIQGAAATLPLMPLLFWLANSSLRPLRRLMVEVEEVLVPYFSSLEIVDFALISLLAGVGEEGLFRGILQGWLAGEISPLFGLSASAILFGLLHWVTPTYALLAALLGLYLGALYLQTGNLVVPMVTHALYDFFALIYLVRWRGKKRAMRKCQTR